MLVKSGVILQGKRETKEIIYSGDQHTEDRKGITHLYLLKKKNPRWYSFLAKLRGRIIRDLTQETGESLTKITISKLPFLPFRVTGFVFPLIPTLYLPLKQKAAWGLDSQELKTYFQLHVG